MCKSCKKKKDKKTTSKSSSKKSVKFAKIEPPKKLSNHYHPPKPPSQWLLWQTYFTLQCFHDDIYRTRTLNRVLAPFAFSTQIAALQRASTGNTFKFITKLLHFEGFYAAKTFEHDLLQVLQDFPFNTLMTEKEIRNIVTVSKFIFCNDIKPAEKWKQFVTESMKLEIATIKASEIHEKYLTIQKLLNAAIGIEFAVSNEEKLCRKETKLLSIVGTRIKAKFANTETYFYKNTSFLLGYGIKEKNHPFFIAVGEFANVIFNDFEAWRIPLKQNDQKGGGYEPKMSLILIRPNCIGNIVSTKSTETFDEIAKAINILIQRKRKKATLLLPQMDLPFSNHTTYGITDFTSNWKQTFGEQITSSLGKIADGIFTTCPLDRFFHCASFRLSTFGVSFQGDTETNTIPANKKILQPENSNKPKPLKNEDDDNTKSAKLHRMIKAQMKIPEGLIKPRRERLYHFNARFDSPFLFFIVDEKWASILMAGLYAGTPAMTTEAMTRSATPKQLNSRNKKKPISSALIKAKKPKKKCLVC